MSAQDIKELQHRGQRRQQERQKSAKMQYSVLLTWPASMQIYWNKRKRLHGKRVQLPEDWFGTLGHQHSRRDVMRKHPISLDWQNDNFARASRLRHENAYFHAL